jgi:hypothetical protein
MPLGHRCCQAYKLQAAAPACLTSTELAHQVCDLRALSKQDAGQRAAQAEAKLQGTTTHLAHLSLIINGEALRCGSSGCAASDITTVQRTMVSTLRTEMTTKAVKHHVTSEVASNCAARSRYGCDSGVAMLSQTHLKATSLLPLHKHAECRMAFALTPFWAAPYA